MYTYKLQKLKPAFYYHISEKSTQNTIVPVVCLGAKLGDLRT